MATWVLAGTGPSMTSARAHPWLVLSLQVPRQTRTPGTISFRLVMWSLKWFLCISMAVTCVYALMFTSLTEKVEEIQEKLVCEGHFLIWQNLQEYAWDWFEITLLWLFFIVLMYVTVKLAGESGKSKMQTPAACQGRSFGSLRRKKEKSSSEEDYMFHTLILLEMYLVKFVSSVRNLKLTTSTGGNHNPLNVEVPADLLALGKWRIQLSGFVSQSRRGIVERWHILSKLVKLFWRERKKPPIFFICCIVLAFPECHIIGCMKCIIFSKLTYFT